MKKKILLLCVVIFVIIIFTVFKIYGYLKLEEFKETLNEIIKVTEKYYRDCDCDLFGDGPFDIKSGEIQFKNSKSIKSGEVTYDGKNYYIIEVTNGDFCAKGTLDSYDIYKGECYNGSPLEKGYSKK